MRSPISPPAWILAACVLGAAAACVPLVELESKPCPCAEGFSCCETLGVCLSGSQRCPASYPASSGAACSRDRQCQRAEACHAWTTGDDAQTTPAGPRQCRRQCDPSISCADGEVCLLAPHDGQPLSAFRAAPLCLPRAARAGRGDGGGADGGQPVGDGGQPDRCEAWSCQGCPADKIGKTFCQGDDLYGCLVATDPQCGLKCRKVKVQSCKRCVESGGSTTCDAANIVPDDPCEDFPCTAPGCGASAPSYCSDGKVATCLRVAFQGSTCSRLCRAETLESCSGSCRVSGGRARCE